MITQLLNTFLEGDLSDYLALIDFRSIIWALIIIIVGRWLAGRARNWFVRAVHYTDVNLNKSLVNVVELLIYYGILISALVLALAALGIPMDALITLLAVIAILLAIALQGSLTNLAATVIFLVFHTFKAGDWVLLTGDTFGQVLEIQMFTTVILTQERSTTIIPNGHIISDNIVNYSVLGYRRADLITTVTYDDDLPMAKQVLEEILADNKLVLAEPAPVVGVLELGDKGVVFSVRPFVAVDTYWEAIFTISEAIKLRLDAAGITLAIPQQAIHIHQTN